MKQITEVVGEVIALFEKAFRVNCLSEDKNHTKVDVLTNTRTCLGPYNCPSVCHTMRLLDCNRSEAQNVHGVS